MIICDSRRFVFVHVQKTGGSTITKMIRAQLPAEEIRSNAKRHAPLRRIVGREPELADYFVFGFVPTRGPHGLVVEPHRGLEAHYRKRGIPFEQKQNPFFRRCAKFETFDDFVLNGTAELPRIRQPQIRYLRAPGGKRAEFIGRTENFNADVATALNRVGLDASGLVHHNKGTHDPRTYRDYYTPATRARVEELFAPDIREFDYRF